MMITNLMMVAPLLLASPSLGSGSGELQYKVLRGVRYPIAPVKPTLTCSRMQKVNMFFRSKKKKQAFQNELEERRIAYEALEERFQRERRRASKEFETLDRDEKMQEIVEPAEQFEELFPEKIRELIKKNGRMPHDMEIMDALKMNCSWTLNNEKAGGWLNDMKKRLPDSNPFTKFYKFFAVFKVIRKRIRENPGDLADYNLVEPKEILTESVWEAVKTEEKLWKRFTTDETGHERSPTEDETKHSKLFRQKLIEELEKHVKVCVEDLEKFRGAARPVAEGGNLLDSSEDERGLQRLKEFFNRDDSSSREMEMSNNSTSSSLNVQEKSLTGGAESR